MTFCTLNKIYSFIICMERLENPLMFRSSFPYNIPSKFVFCSTFCSTVNIFSYFSHLLYAFNNIYPTLHNVQFYYVYFWVYVIKKMIYLHSMQLKRISTEIWVTIFYLFNKIAFNLYAIQILICLILIHEWIWIGRKLCWWGYLKLLKLLKTSYA